MNNKEDRKSMERKVKDIKKKLFVEPVLKVYEPLVDITLFTSFTNVTGGTFF